MNALKLLQEKVGAVADGSFGPNTARAIADFYGLPANRGAHLMGQAAHESSGFRQTRENLNYSVAALCRVWPSRFPTPDEAAAYARNPQKLAEKVYSGRMGNGPEGSGDASLFIGRGFIQLTGKDNYRRFSAGMRLPNVMQDPSLAEEVYAFETAIWYFDANGLFAIADRGVDTDTIRKVTKLVNGGYHGLEDREHWTKKIHGWLAPQSV